MNIKCINLFKTLLYRIHLITKKMQIASTILSRYYLKMLLMLLFIK